MDTRRKILLIDDDITGSKIVSTMLEQRGFHVLTLNDSRKALDAVRTGKPELILLDLLMPDVSGIDVLKSIRAEVSPMDLPVVMLTSVDNSEDIANCLVLGANDYLTKPMDVEVAVARITTQLKLVDLNRDSLKKKEIETLNAMIVTYNHEINNPLAVAMLSLGADASQLTSEQLDDARNAIRRIADIVKKIDRVTEKSVVVEEYSQSSKMIKL